MQYFSYGMRDTDLIIFLARSANLPEGLYIPFSFTSPLSFPLRISQLRFIVIGD